jgi:hypothetical protein
MRGTCIGLMGLESVHAVNTSFISDLILCGVLDSWKGILGIAHLETLEVLSFLTPDFSLVFGILYLVFVFLVLGPVLLLVFWISIS